MYAKLIASGSVDERTALMLFLLVEKLRGEVRTTSLQTIRHAFRLSCCAIYCMRNLRVERHYVSLELQCRSLCYHHG